MKSKEDMIDWISEQDEVINACRAYDSNCGTVTEIVDEVIKALCGALPDTLKTHEYYNKLKQWGE